MDESSTSLSRLVRIHQESVDADKLAEFAKSKGVRPEAFRYLHVGWCPRRKAWSFPERDVDGAVVSIEYRYESGKKMAMKGRPRGLKFPVNDWGNFCDSDSKFVALVEGATDAAAVMSAGELAIGRPSARSSTAVNEWLKKMLAGWDVLIAVESDETGITSAYEYATMLRPIARKVWVVDSLPDGIKDFCDWRKANDVDFDETIRSYHLRPPYDPANVTEGLVLKNDTPKEVATAFLESRWTVRGTRTLKYHRGDWYAWSGKVYSRMSTEAVKRSLFEWEDGIEVASEEGNKPLNLTTDSKVGSVLTRIKSSQEVDGDPPLWLHSGNTPLTHLADPRYLIAAEDGVVDLSPIVNRSGPPRFTQHTPDLFATHLLPIVAEGGRSDRTITDRVVSEIIPDEEDVRAFWEWAGYLLIDDNRFEKFLVLQGHPGAGKGTLFSIFQNLLGPAAGTAELSALADPFTLGSFYGKKACIMGDAHLGGMVDRDRVLGVFKQITGNDYVTINRKYQQPFQAKMRTRIVMGVNETPEFNDGATALRRRIHLIWCQRASDRMDPELKHKMSEPDEVAVQFDRAVEGLERLFSRDSGGFTTSDRSTAIQQSFIESMSPVDEFVNEMCVLDSSLYTPTAELFEAYRLWARGAGRARHKTCKNHRDFGRSLVNSTRVAKRRVRSGSDRCYAYYGIGLAKGSPVPQTPLVPPQDMLYEHPNND